MIYTEGVWQEVGARLDLKSGGRREVGLTNLNLKIPLQLLYVGASHKLITAINVTFGVCTAQQIGGR